MKLLDVNVILAAHRTDHPDYGLARPWLQGLLERGEPFSVVDMVAGSFLRIATNRRVFALPTPVGAAFEYLRTLRAEPGHMRLLPGSRHLEIMERLCVRADAAGDLVADAQLAAIAVEHAAELVSFDRDFARFDELVWRVPDEQGDPASRPSAGV